MKKDYQIAGHRIRIEGSEMWIHAVSSLDGFKPFEVEPEVGVPISFCSQRAPRHSLESEDIPLSVSTAQEILCAAAFIDSRP